MLTLIENGDVYAPEPRGRASVLLVGDTIAKVGPVDGRAIAALGAADLALAVVDAAGCVVTPGFLDPHEHLLGGSGEEGFATQTPEIVLSEIVPHGITTVVGALGVDTTMKTMAGLLARVKGLREEGLTAYLWSGGYDVPPVTITRSLREDLLFIEEVIGAGEVAIADHRSTDPQVKELARLVLDTHVGGMLSRKAGVTHFHVGGADQRLRRLRELLDGDSAVTPEMLYPTHIERSEALMDEAIALAARGAHADIDTVEGELARWVRYWFDHGGDPARLTVSSDSGASSPGMFAAQWRDCVLRHGLPLERMLPLVTSNTASVLKLGRKGRLVPGGDADVLVLRRDSLDPVHVFARGQRMVDDGRLVAREHFLRTSRRQIHLEGTKATAQ
jgi:beta-aspartyl-dipeptidase (metallo-type)